MKANLAFHVRGAVNRPEVSMISAGSVNEHVDDMLSLCLVHLARQLRDIELKKPSVVRKLRRRYRAHWIKLIKKDPNIFRNEVDKMKLTGEEYVLLNAEKMGKAAFDIAKRDGKTEVDDEVVQEAIEKTEYHAKQLLERHSRKKGELAPDFVFCSR